MEQRKIQTKSDSLRKELERFVYSTNIILKDKVETMDIILLLRNVHPFWRSDLATRLKNENMISRDEASEFTTSRVEPIFKFR